MEPETEPTTYHPTPKQWRPADEIMQREAIKPPHSRPAVSYVVNLIMKSCFCGAPKIPVYTAIRKRYMIYFLGSQGVDGASLVECGDIMMRSAWTEVPQRTPGQLAKHVKNSYFAKSKSQLHTRDAIETRYKSLFMWREADELIKDLIHQGVQLQIKAVVFYIKRTFFVADLEITESHIQDRYCRLLGIKNNPAHAEGYGEKFINQELSTLYQPSSMSQAFQRSTDNMQLPRATMPSNVPLEFYSSSFWVPLTLPKPTPATVQAGTASTSKRMPPPTMPSQSHFNPEPASSPSPSSHKRSRRDSYSSTTTTSTSDHSTQSSYINFSRAQLHRVEIPGNIRDSGYFSNGGSSDA